MQKSLKKYFPIFALPTLLAFTIGFIVPFILGIYLSFCKFTTVTDAKFVGFSNYAKIFTDKTFGHALWYTALFTIVSVLLINILAFTVAMLLTKGIKGTNIFPDSILHAKLNRRYRFGIYLAAAVKWYPGTFPEDVDL